METATRIFSAGYYAHVVQGVVSDFMPPPTIFAEVPPHALKTALLATRLAEVCRDFDAFFIDDIHPFEENERILSDRLRAAAQSFLGR